MPMLAAVWYGRRDVRIEERPEPQPHRGQVKIKVAWCGICGSDLYEYTDGPYIIPVERPHPLTGKKAPIILGHEFSGEVIAVGEGVNGFRLGDRVGVHACIACGECYWCQRNAMNYCLKLGSTGLCEDGGFAEYAVVPEYATFKLADKVSYEAGSFIEPLSVALHAVRRGGVEPGTKVAVVGAGPIGLLVIQAALAAGATEVYAVEILPRRKELAAQVGATRVFDPNQCDAGKEIHALTGGIRVDVAFECAGGKNTLSLAANLTRRGGRIVNVAVPKTNEAPLDRMFLHEKNMLISYAYVDEAPTAATYLADGRVKAETLVTAKIKLPELVENGFEELLTNGAEHVKILVSPRKGESGE